MGPSLLRSTSLILTACGNGPRCSERVRLSSEDQRQRRTMLHQEGTIPYMQFALATSMTHFARTDVASHQTVLFIRFFLIAVES